MRKFYVLACIAMFSLVESMAQTIPASGKITDDKGAPVAFATIMERNTRRATTSAADGSFSLTVRPGAHLVISSVGYESLDVAAGTSLRIQLVSDSRQLSDVVITGVGVATSKKKVPIDVATLSSKDFAKSATLSIEQALTGQIAGAQIQQTSGKPGSSFNIQLRGINSLDGTQPLILLDGIEVKDLTSLDPSIIDRVEVVKGAAGGTLYGAQGANGVIQLFTKKGTQGTPLSISLSSKISIDNILKANPVLARYHHYVTDAAGNILDASGNIIKPDATGTWPDPAVPDPGVNPDLVNNKTYNLPVYDHFKEAYRQALTYSHTLSLSGGGAKSDYAFGASRLDQQDVFSNVFHRTNFSLNIGFQPVHGLGFRSTTQVIVGSENLLNGNRFEVLNAYPWVDLNWKDSTGHRAIKTSSASNQNNSLSEQDWHQRNNQTLELVQNFTVDYKFPRYVELDFKYGISYAYGDGTDYYLNQSGALQSSLHWGPDRLGSITDAYSKNTFQNALSTLYLKTDFQKDFHINVPIHTTTQVSYDWRSTNFRSYFAEGIELPPYPPANISVAQIKNDGDNSTAFTTFGVLVNQSIDFGNIAGISGGFRSDYSSEFGQGSKPFTFPRGTVYFRPSEFMKGLSFLGDWKIRGAYGEAGIQPPIYSRQVTFDVNTLGTAVALSLPVLARNPNLQVQLSKELEIGTDISIRPFKGNWVSKLGFSGSYWERNSEAIIQPASVAPTSGFGSRQDNLSNLHSTGVDLSLDATVYSSTNISWNMGIRWGYTKTTVTKIANGLDVIAGEFAIRQGQQLGILYGQSPLHSLSQPGPGGKPYLSTAQQGSYVIANGNVVNPATNSVVLTAANDLSVIGNVYPDFTSSFINTVTLHKHLTLSMQVDWVHGNSIYNITRQWLYSPAGGSGGAGGVSQDFDKAVTIGTKTGAFVNYYQSLYNLVKPTSNFSEDGSFARLRDLSLSYDLTGIVKAGWVKRLAVTVSGRNLVTITHYSGLDPENTTNVDSQGNALNGIGAFKGIDSFGVPNLRSYQFGVNVGF